MIDPPDDWVVRPDPNDMYTLEINPNADPDCEIPLHAGMICNGIAITQTRNYTIRELRSLTSSEPP